MKQNKVSIDKFLGLNVVKDTVILTWDSVLFFLFF